jgi:hypothetical protein
MRNERTAGAAAPRGQGRLRGNLPQVFRKVPGGPSRCALLTRENSWRFHGTGPPGAYETRVQRGQTRETMSTAQLPFQADQAGLLRAGASLGVLAPNALFSSRVTSVQVEILLQVRAATPADELHLELKADPQQWCVRATDGRGARPSGPLFLATRAVSARVTNLGEVPSATGDAWAQRWTQMGSPPMLAAGPVMLTVWVGGPRYVTARAESVVAGGP